MPIGKKLDTPESREFWRLAQQASKEVAQLPEWQRKVMEDIYNEGINYFQQSIVELQVNGTLQREWIKIDVAEQIAKALKAMGISKAELARRLGVSRAYITQIMRGDCNVSITKLADIATALGKRVKIEFVEEDR